MPSDVDVQNLSPDHQLRGFSKSPFMRNLLLAAMLHIIVIGGTSVGMLIGEEEKKDQEDEGDKVAKVEDDTAEAEPSSNGQQPADAAADDSDAKPSADAAVKTDGAEEGEEKREPSEYEKEHMMEKEAPPTSPDASDIDISLDDYGL